MIVPLVPKLQPLVPPWRTIVTRNLGLRPQRNHYTMKSGTSERIAFVLDFDGTITTKDTISTLAGIGLSFPKRTNDNNLEETWNRVLENYSRDHSKHVQNYKPTKEERRTLDEEINYYRSLRDVELKSFERVSTSGVFRGIASNEWKQFGHECIQDKRVEVRDGFQDFVTRIRKYGSTWGIVSVNFSSHFIRGVLEASIGDENAQVNVLANSITEKGSIVGLALQENAPPALLATSDKKLFALRELGNQWRQALQQGEEKIDRLVYIGDSGTDIECLTAEDVIGIVISEDGQSDLMKSLKCISRLVVPVRDFVEASRAQLYWARDFDEILNSPLFTSKGYPN